MARLLSAATADVEHVLEPAMRAYHIRISLARQNPSQSSSSATSTSYKQTSAISGAQAFVPSSLFQPLPSHAPRFASRRNTFSVQNLSAEKQPEDPERRDYRFGPLRIDWVEFSDMDAPRSSFMKVGSASGSGKDKEKSAQRRGGLSSTLSSLSPAVTSETAACSAGEPATAKFVPSPAHTKSGSTNLPEGVVHIFRDYPRSTEEHSKSAPTYAAAAANGPAQSAQSELGQESQTNVESDDVTLAVLAVPSWMTPSDFLAFVAPAADGIAHLRMIR